MNIVIFGANGPVGRILTERALAEGHAVRAVTRHPEAFPVRQDQLHVIQGNVRNRADMRQAVTGQDVVLSLYGRPYTFRRVDLYSEGMTNILSAMREAGICRLVSTTAGGTRSEYHPEEGFVFGRIIKPIIGRTLYADMRRMEKLVMRSDRDWTIVRPARLVNTETVTGYRVAEGYMADGLHETSRADLADFLLQEASRSDHVHEAVAIGTET